MDPTILTDTETAIEESMEKIFELLEEKKYFMARDELLKYNNADIAEMFEEMLEDPERLERTIVVYRLLPKDVSVEVFSYLPSDDQLKIVDGITDKELTYIIAELDFDDKIDILEELPANLVDKILEKTPKDERRLINTFLNYPDNCAGSLMTPDYISLEKEWTVARAMQHIKEVGMDAETVYTCYVKDTGRKLIGIVSLSTLVVADDNRRIMDIMHTDYVCVNVYDDREEVSEDFKKYGFIAMPVVDKEHRLVGIITVDDILDVIEEENTEDIERMAGIIDLEQSDQEYLDKSVLKHAKNRLPWLLVMMVSAMVTGAIINSFENLLSSVIVLVSYIPLLMGTGGNTGAQASTLIIRGLALGEVELKDALKVLWKEIRISLCVGLVLSVVNFLKIILIDKESWLIALTVCLSMIIIIMFAKAIGGMVPLLAEKIGADPALMANPIIASSVDMLSVLIYFLMASLILGL
ncbi:MAG: magnesium transporter [Anaerovoracaceae bacterium]